MFLFFPALTLQTVQSFLEYTTKNESYAPICKLNFCKFAYPCNSSSECSEINITLKKGMYLLEVFGGQGNSDGNSYYNFNGYGGYSYAIIEIATQKQFLLYIGAEGNVSSNTTFNGGTRDNNYYRDIHMSGGGATDFRTNYDNKTRFLIAGGGASVHDYYYHSHIRGGGFDNDYNKLERQNEWPGGGGLYPTKGGFGGLGYVHTITPQCDLIEEYDFPEIIEGGTFFDVNPGNGFAKITLLDFSSFHSPTNQLLYTNMKLFRRGRR